MKTEIKSYKKGIYNYLEIENVGLIEYIVSFDVVDITNVFINEDKRRNGYATILLTELINESKSKIMLEVREDNEKAINLYKKLGFKVINIRKKYYKDVDALIMERDK